MRASRRQRTRDSQSAAAVSGDASNAAASAAQVGRARPEGVEAPAEGASAGARCARRDIVAGLGLHAAAGGGMPTPAAGLWWTDRWAVWY